MVWVLVGVRGCVLRPQGIAWLHCVPCPCRLRTGRCIRLQASYRLIILITYLGMGAWKTCYSLVMGFGSFWTDCLGGFWVRRSLHRTESETQGRGLGVTVWTGTWTPGQEGDRLVLLVPQVQVERVFTGYPAGGINQRIAGKSGTACLRPSTVVRTEK